VLVKSPRPAQASTNPYRPQHRQALGDIVHLRRNSGPEITITAVRD